MAAIIPIPVPAAAPSQVVVTMPPECTTSTMIPLLPPKSPLVLPPRKFDPKEYAEYKHLPHMPKNIPQITAWHYMGMIIPVVLLLVLYLHHKDAAAKDLADERSKTKRIKYLLVLGMLFASFVVMVHVQVIPASWVRRVFPRWKLPPPMPKWMKIAIVFGFLVFIVYPTIKFIRRMNVPAPKPGVHKYIKGANRNK